MSDNDSIMRGDVFEAIYALHADGKEGIMNAPRNSYGEDLRDVLDAIADIPAVPHEMSAVEYEKVKDRMRRSNGTDNAYGLYVRALFEGQINEAVAIVEAWAREHPEERSEQ